MTQPKLTAKKLQSLVKQARSALRSAEKKMPNDVRYKGVKADLDGADDLIVKGDLDAAYSHYEKAAGMIVTKAREHLDNLQQRRRKR